VSKTDTSPHRQPLPLPADCFRLEEMQTLRSFDGQVLQEVVYYTWTHATQSGAMQYQFLLCVEMAFESGERLLLSSGENSVSIQVIEAKQLVELARRLQEVHGQPVIHRFSADANSLWHKVLRHPLQSVQLSRHPGSDCYANDVVLFRFAQFPILVGLGIKEGLEISPYAIA
jgi:hypothetical protein